MKLARRSHLYRVGCAGVISCSVSWGPYATIGLVYLCGACQIEVLPQKAKLRNKSSTNRTPAGDLGASQGNPSTVPGATSCDQGENVENCILSAASDVEQVNVTSSPLEGGSENPNSPTIESVSNQTQHNNNNEPGNFDGSETVLNYRPRQTRSSRTGSDDQQVELEASICKFYRQGRCKHGISGKKDGLCQYKHPKVCQKFIANGPKARRGCRQGENCRFFHPRLCNSSINALSCFN